MANPIKWDLERLEKLAAQGLTIKEISAYFNAAPITLYKAIADKPEIAAAMETGRAKGIEFVTSKLMEKIQSGDLNAIIFYLKSKAGWQDKVTVEHSGTVEIAPMSSEQRTARIRELEEKRRLLLGGDRD